MSEASNGTLQNGNFVINGQPVNVQYSPNSAYYYIDTSIAISYTTAVTYGWTTPAGNQIKLKQTCIGPKLYFKYVKSKLSTLQKNKLKANLVKLQKLIVEAKEMNQQALYEQLAIQLAITVRECEAEACGVTQFVKQEVIDKFLYQVKENVVYLKKLEDFPRPIPAKITKKIKQIQNANLFDEYYVLYIDYTGEKVKTNKEKIREKDPIVFGKYSYSKDNYYVIADWVDENCDLSLKTFVDKVRENDPEYMTAQIEKITPEYVEKLKTEVIKRYERLQKTNMQNYKDLMKEEDAETNQQIKQSQNKKERNRFLKRLYKTIMGEKDE